MVMYIVVEGYNNYPKEHTFHLGTKKDSFEHLTGGAHMPGLLFIYVDGDEMTFVKSRFPTLPWRVKSSITYNRGQTFYGDMARLILGNWED